VKIQKYNVVTKLEILLHEHFLGEVCKMKILKIVLQIFGYIWLVLSGSIIAVGIIGVWMNEGFSGVQEFLSPFNVANWIVTALMLAPGLGALTWTNKLQENRI
jgi:hypothetical protein